MQTSRFLLTEDMAREGYSRIAREIQETASGFTRLTVTHELEGTPIMCGMASSKFSEQGTGGWTWILSDLKTLLEPGKSMGSWG